MELFREILNINKKYNLIENNDNIVVGFSGGPDSVFLVEMLKKLQCFFNFKIYLVHILELPGCDQADVGTDHDGRDQVRVAHVVAHVADEGPRRLQRDRKSVV